MRDVLSKLAPPPTPDHIDQSRRGLRLIGRTLQVAAIGFGGCGLWILGAVYLGLPPPPEPFDVFADPQMFMGFILVVQATVNAAIAAFLLSRARNLADYATTADGLFVFRRGAPWRDLAWAEVTEVTRHRFLAGKERRVALRLDVAGPGFTLALPDTLSGFDALRAAINEAARRHRFPLRAVDRTSPRSTQTGTVSEI